MRTRNRIYPPNCTVCDLNPSRFLAYREKQKRVEAEYGFRLGVPCRTEEQKEGRRRYMTDWQRRYRNAHKDELAAYHTAWLERRRAARREEREARRAERQAEKDARKAAWIERCHRVKEKYGFDLGVVPLDMTPEEAEARRRYAEDRQREYREAHKAELAERHKAYNERLRIKRARRRQSLANLEKAREKQRELKRQREAEAKAAKRRALEEKQRAVLEKYGFVLGKKPVTPEEMAGRERYIEDRDRQYRQAYKEKLKERNRRKAEQRARLKEMNEARRKASAEEKRQAKAARRIEERERRRAKAIALSETERIAGEAFAAEREANRKAYLEKKEEANVDSPIVPIPTTLSSEPPIIQPPEDTFVTGGSDDDDEEELDRMREEAAQAARAAKEAEREAMRKARQEARQSEKQAKLEAERRARAEFKAKARELNLPLQKARWTPAHQKIWDKAMRREKRKQLDAKRDERRRKRQAEAEERAARMKALEERRRVIFEKYGFTLGKKPVTPEEIEGRRRYDRDMEAAERERRHDKINEYNREYRRRKRREELERAQEKWSAAQWAEWEKRQESKGRGTPAWLVREVAKYLADESALTPDQVMAWLIEHDGIDFLAKGAESMGRKRLLTKAAVPMAARAVMFFISPDRAVMFPRKREGGAPP